jgi:hypothetical protein
LLLYILAAAPMKGLLPKKTKRLEIELQMVKATNTVDVVNFKKE